MDVDWPSVPLSELVDPQRGISYRIVQPGSPVPDGVPIVRVSDVRYGRIDVRSPLRVAADIERAYGRTRLRGGELLITIVGTVGETAIVPPDMAGWNVARAIAVLPVKPEVGSYWVQLGLRSSAAASMIQSRLNTTVQATLNLGDLSRLPIMLPPPDDRQAIASILGALDDKIELNRRVNETLEAMARAIFKDWFVAFGPTRAKMEGRPSYLAPDLWALFPDRLDAEGKPDGWPTRRVEGLLGLAYGKSLPATVRTEGPYPVYGSGGVTGFHADAITQPPCIVVGRKGTVGSLFWDDRPCFPIDTVFYVLPKAPMIFCFYLLGSLGLETMNTDAAVPGLNRSNVYRLDGTWGTPELRVAFDGLVAVKRQKMFANDEENRTLAATRDLLLPRLMSGELRVKDAEPLVAEVA